MLMLAFTLASAAIALTPPPKPLHFDLAALPITRDSFVFYLDDSPRGWAVWQYELRTQDNRQELLYTAGSDFEPSIDERIRVVVDRQSGVPLASFRHTEFSGPSDTLMLEHDLHVQAGRVVGRRIVATKLHGTDTIAVDQSLPPDAVWSSYEL